MRKHRLEIILALLALLFQWVLLAGAIAYWKEPLFSQAFIDRLLGKPSSIYIGNITEVEI